MQKQTESEVKLVSVAVSQFKFNLIASATKVIEVVRNICELLGITCGQMATLEIDDTYYDDNNRTLAKKGCSIRHRAIKDNGSRVTFKMGKPSSLKSELEREEVEFDCNEIEFKLMLADNFASKLTEAFKGGWCQDENCGQLRKSLTVHNRRSLLPIQTQIGSYEFCFDKFYYEDPDGGAYSEYFAEIELETKAPPSGDDQLLHQLVNSLQVILDFDGHNLSKYKRGAQWLVNKSSDYKTVHTLMFDIIGYSKVSAAIQKQMIQALNHSAKLALRKHRPNDFSDIVCIPTGDGMIMVFENGPASLVSLVFELQDSIRYKHNVSSVNCAFEFRAGLHTGPVFKYSDINERLNYAGNGINMAQRAMACGSGWHLLATKDAREQVVQINGGLTDLFHKLQKPITTKHGETLEIYNVYDRTGHGNRADPV